jgi:hypothetical protein
MPAAQAPPAPPSPELVAQVEACLPPALVRAAWRAMAAAHAETAPAASSRPDPGAPLHLHQVMARVYGVSEAAALLSLALVADVVAAMH